MKRIMWLAALMLVGLTVTPAAADFYVIAGGGRLGTQISSLPYAISIPGLYYLDKNFTSSATTNSAITVHANDVTIDLNGFCLTGPGKGSGAGNHGIVVAATHKNVEIRNGSVKDFGYEGIQSQSDCTGIRVVGLRVRDTGRFGIYLQGSDNLVMDCAVMNVGASGIIVGPSSLVKGSQVGGKASIGISLTAGSAALGNTVRGTSWGIDAKVGSLVTDNTVSGSLAEGIVAADNCTVTRNTANNNTGTGIAAGNYCTITNNTADGLTYGANCTRADNTVTP